MSFKINWKRILFDISTKPRPRCSGKTKFSISLTKVLDLLTAIRCRPENFRNFGRSDIWYIWENGFYFFILGGRDVVKIWVFFCEISYCLYSGFPIHEKISFFSSFRVFHSDFFEISEFSTLILIRNKNIQNLILNHQNLPSYKPCPTQVCIH